MENNIFNLMDKIDKHIEKQKNIIKEINNLLEEDRLEKERTNKRLDELKEYLTEEGIDYEKSAELFRE